MTRAHFAITGGKSPGKGMASTHVDILLRRNKAVVGTDAPVVGIPRNHPCPCGSKKKYKLCCGSGR